MTPTYQESENIEEFLRRARAAAPDADILVVDDNSPDGTADLADEVGAELGNIEVLRRPRKIGIGDAVRAGFASGSTAATTSSCRSTPTSRTIRRRCPNCSARSSGAPTPRSARATCPAGRSRTGRGTGG